MRYIQELSIPFLYNLVKKGFSEKQRADDYQLYCSIFPHYNEKNVVSFDKFLEIYRPSKTKMAIKSKDEIMNELLGGVS